jgi:hypothetical protein
MGFGGLLVTAARAELEGSLDTCPDSRTPLGQRLEACVCQRSLPAAVLSGPPGGESVKTLNLVPVKRPQCTDRGFETFGSSRLKHKLFPFHLG